MTWISGQEPQLIFSYLKSGLHRFTQIVVRPLHKLTKGFANGIAISGYETENSMKTLGTRASFHKLKRNEARNSFHRIDFEFESGVDFGPGDKTLGPEV
jgi:hypothetical protein